MSLYHLLLLRNLISSHRQKQNTYCFIFCLLFLISPSFLVIVCITGGALILFLFLWLNLPHSLLHIGAELITLFHILHGLSLAFTQRFHHPLVSWMGFPDVDTLMLVVALGKKSQELLQSCLHNFTGFRVVTRVDTSVSATPTPAFMEGWVLSHTASIEHRLHA